MKITITALILAVMCGVSWGGDYGDPASDYVSITDLSAATVDDDVFTNATTGGYEIIMGGYEVTRALELALKYLKKSDAVEFMTLEYTPPSTAMREAADAMDQKDEDIDYIRKTLEALRGND